MHWARTPLSVFTLSSSLFLLLLSSVSHATKRPFTVVIDPGHGGSDHGATHRLKKTLYQEKHFTLALAKEVARQLNKRKIRTILTRTNDKELSLADRTAKANLLKADLFISLHMNSVPKRKANRNLPQQDDPSKPEGIETYILNTTSNEGSKRLADLENKHGLLDSSVANVSGDSDNASDVNLIVKDLLLDANFSKSRHAACLLQSKLVSATATPSKSNRNRGVKQALFYVLLGADMPSVLVEAGFIDNYKDRGFILSPWGKRRLAKAVAASVEEFQKTSETAVANNELSTCQIH